MGCVNNKPKKFGDDGNKKEINTRVVRRSQWGPGGGQTPNKEVDSPAMIEKRHDKANEKNQAVNAAVENLTKQEVKKPAAPVAQAPAAEEPKFQYQNSDGNESGSGAAEGEPDMEGLDPEQAVQMKAYQVWMAYNLTGDDLLP